MDTFLASLCLSNQGIVPQQEVPSATLIAVKLYLAYTEHLVAVHASAVVLPGSVRLYLRAARLAVAQALMSVVDEYLPVSAADDLRKL